jgi:hypothetical protein
LTLSLKIVKKKWNNKYYDNTILMQEDDTLRSIGEKNEATTPTKTK